MNRRFVVREATLAEFDDLLRFYNQNRDPHVMLRDDASVKRAISEGVFFVALDTSRPDDDRIFAASAVYTISVAEPDGSQRILKEAGGSNVAEAYRGFRIHQIFHAARAIHIAILEAKSSKDYFGAIICPNPPSETNIDRAGFAPWPDAPVSLQLERAPYAAPGQHIGYYLFRPEALQDQARFLLEQEMRGLLERRSEDGSRVEQVETIIVLETLKRYRPVVERLSNGDYSDFT